MAVDKVPELEARVTKLQTGLDEALRQIHWMKTRGGFTDAKTHSVRATRIEERLERLELDGSMLKDFAGLVTDWMAKHLTERHAIGENDNAPDSIFVRKIRRRLAEWAEKAGLMGKRRDVTSSRQDENRLRPQQVANS